MSPEQYRDAASRLGRSIAGGRTGMHLELEVDQSTSQRYADGSFPIPGKIAALMAYWLKTNTPPSEALKEQQL